MSWRLQRWLRRGGMAAALMVFAWPVAAQQTPESTTAWTTDVTAVRMRTGDQPAWADPAYDDSAWPVMSLAEVRPSGPVFWLRAEVTLDPESLASGRPLGVRFVAMASCELFWRGRRIASNGVVGASAAQEVPGWLDWHVPLPRDLHPGRQTIALRCSAHHRGFEPFMGFYVLKIGDYLDIVKTWRDDTTWTQVMAGGLLAIGLFHVLSFGLAGRSRSHLWLGLFAATGGVLVIVENLRSWWPYTYDWHLGRLLAITALTWALNALLLAFVAARFPWPGGRQVLVAGHVAMICSLAIPSFDAKAAALWLVGLCLALGWTVRAVLAGHREAGFAVAGLAVCLAAGIWQPWAFLDYSLFFTLAALAVCLLVAHVLADARQRREHERQRREHAAIELRSARLEIELLRRHLQPHVLMNTLTALSEWFEEAPEVAAEMVQDLGRELRILADVSKRRLIPLGLELDLCQSHLAVMARRRDETLRLVADRVDRESLVPPAIFHTLLENALTHNDYRATSACFRLREDLGTAVRTYVFEAPYCARPGQAAEASSAAVRDGTGLRYVRARLRESFGEDFRFDDGPAERSGDEAVWRTTIEVPARVRPPIAEEEV